MSPVGTHSLADVRIRYPFLLTAFSERAYYLYGSTNVDPVGPEGTELDCYRSADLQSWEGPIPAFRPPPGFWATRAWEPEVHAYAGRYFMFATFDAADAARSTQILVADRPAGPYSPWSSDPVTPADWDCSGGTLHVDELRDPWIVFSHDWTQAGDGEIVAQRLSGDLRRPMGRPLVLFCGSDAEWTRGLFRPRVAAADVNHVAGGPFVHRLRTGELIIVWSSVGTNGYGIGVARSENGRIAGRWLQQEEPLCSRDGGHSMIARTLDGQLLLIWHQPNETPFERAVFRPIVETAKSVRFPGGSERVRWSRP